MKRKKVKFLALIMSALMTLCLLCSCGAPAEDDVPLSSRYIYDSLQGHDKEVFHRIYSGVTNYKYKIRIGGMNEKEFNDLMMKFYCCGSEFFYMSDLVKYQVNGDGKIAEAYFNYDYYNKSADSMREQLAAAEDKILEGITDDMTDADKLKYIHDYLISNVTYDAEAMDCDNVYGALIKHRTHCQGFSKSVCCLCDRLGIESMLVTGDAGGGHMWNMVKVDGQWYNLDVTWDDPDMGRRKFDNYFLISDTKLSATHTKDSYMNYPSAPSDYNYKG